MVDNEFDWIPNYAQPRKTRKRATSALGYFIIFAVGVLVMLIAGTVALAPGIAVGLLILVSSLFIYFLPTLIALSCHHVNVTAIVVLNVLVGWTFLGWVAALVWACMDSQRRN